MENKDQTNWRGRFKERHMIPIALTIPIYMGIYFLFKEVLSSAGNDVIYYYGTIAAFSGIAIVAFMQVVNIKYALVGFISIIPLLSRLKEKFLPHIFGIAISIETMIILSLLLFVLLDILDRKAIKKDIIVPIYLIIISWLLIATLIINSHIDQSNNVIWGGIVIPFFLYVSLVAVNDSRKDTEAIINSLVAALFISGLFSLVQPIISNQLLMFLYMRNPSFYYNPNIFGEIIIAIIPLVVYKLINAPNGFKRSIFGVVLLISTLALIFTGSKGGLIAFALQIAIMLYYHKNLYKKIKENVLRHWFITLILLGVVVYNLPMLFDTVFRRFFTLELSNESSSTNERLSGWSAAISMGLSSFLGVGLDNFKYVYPTLGSSGELFLESAHNFFLHIFAETGIVGSTLFMLSVIIFIVRIYNIGLTRVGNIKVLSIYLRASLYGYLAYSFMVGGEFNHNDINANMLFLASIMAVITIASRIKSDSI